jgi:hypothetical protein
MATFPHERGGDITAPFLALAGKNAWCILAPHEGLRGAFTLSLD